LLSYLIFFNFLTLDMINIAIPMHITWTAATDARIVTQVILLSSNHETSFSPHPSCDEKMVVVNIKNIISQFIISKYYIIANDFTCYILHFSSFLVWIGHQIVLILHCFLGQHLDNMCHLSTHCLLQILFEDFPIHNNQAIIRQTMHLVACWRNTIADKNAICYLYLISFVISINYLRIEG